MEDSDGAPELDSSFGLSFSSSSELIGDADIDDGDAELLDGSAELLSGLPGSPPWAATAGAIGSAMKATRAVAVASPPSAMADMGVRRSHQRFADLPRGSC